jgi:hypothetical protein
MNTTAEGTETLLFVGQLTSRISSTCKHRLGAPNLTRNHYTLL